MSMHASLHGRSDEPIEARFRRHNTSSWVDVESDRGRMTVHVGALSPDQLRGLAEDLHKVSQSLLGLALMKEGEAYLSQSNV